MSLAEGIETIQEHIKMMPNKPGVYRMLDAEGKPLYIGKAKNLPKRVVSYTKPKSMPYRLQRMVSHTVKMEFSIVKTETAALLLEAMLIKELQPPFNIQLKDGKSFPYIFLSSDMEFNMMLKHRGKQKRKGSYFGPYLSAWAMRNAMDSLQKAFPLRTCSDSVFKSRTRPCLEYQIKRCTAPCVNKIPKDEYDGIVIQAKKFLSGKTSEVQKSLATQMQGFSDEHLYEDAAIIRDRIKALSRIQSEHRLNLGTEDMDVIVICRQEDKVCVHFSMVRQGQSRGNASYFPKNLSEDDSKAIEEFLMQLYLDHPLPKMILTNAKLENVEVLEAALSERSEFKIKVVNPKKGVKAELIKYAEQNAKDALHKKISENTNQNKLLELVAEEFKLGETPERIEVYDNSHIQGTNAVGGMIVVTADGFDKKSYRKFNIKNSRLSDDYDMMREVLSRRFKRAINEKTVMPDLILIDGGAGHLTVTIETLADLGVNDVAIVAIAKGPERNAGKEEYHQPKRAPFSLERNSQLSYFMQRIRDEAHRFAITTHRAKRSKDTIKSALDEIEGIGAKRKKLLLNHFGSVDSIKQASIKDLEQVEGINQKTASQIYNYFN